MEYEPDGSLIFFSILLGQSELVPVTEDSIPFNDQVWFKLSINIVNATLHAPLLTNLPSA